VTLESLSRLGLIVGYSDFKSNAGHVPTTSVNRIESTKEKALFNVSRRRIAKPFSSLFICRFLRYVLGRHNGAALKPPNDKSSATAATRRTDGNSGAMPPFDAARGCVKTRREHNTAKNRRSHFGYSAFLFSPRMI